MINRKRHWERALRVDLVNKTPPPAQQNHIPQIISGVKDVVALLMPLVTFFLGYYLSDQLKFRLESEKARVESAQKRYDVYKSLAQIAGSDANPNRSLQTSLSSLALS